MSWAKAVPIMAFFREGPSPGCTSRGYSKYRDEKTSTRAIQGLKYFMQMMKKSILKSFDSVFRQSLLTMISKCKSTTENSYDEKTYAPALYLIHLLEWNQSAWFLTLGYYTFWARVNFWKLKMALTIFLFWKNDEKNGGKAFGRSKVIFYERFAFFFLYGRTAPMLPPLQRETPALFV